MLPVALCHKMNHMHARFERMHHACRRLVEPVVGHMIEQVTLEFEVDDEVDMRPAACWRERPRVC